ncbi:hypothetical protein [Aquimarina megaterium]|uniref:hypothetical protein n=1 Tax=Aquimarina megaterium TaxID=1443666 RepID=UPI000472335E|nr:hypothetical protein [Aquimarina megaterium]
MEIVMEKYSEFLNALDWVYIFSFILITQAIKYYKLPEFIGNGTDIRLKNRVQVAIIGLVYGVIYFFVRDCELSQLLWIPVSFIFATGFHKFLFEFAFDKFLPKKKVDTSNEDLL